MRAIHQQAAHRRKISEALVGRKYICSICGEEGHNKRGCPQAEKENAQVLILPPCSLFSATVSWACGKVTASARLVLECAGIASRAHPAL